MGLTKIEWADYTWNPWVGCTRVSAGCDHCYAETWARRTGAAGLWEGGRRQTGLSVWEGPRKWNAAAKAAGVRRRVFCASLADFFDNQVDWDWRDDAWDVISNCLDLDWLLLTKRPENIPHMLPNHHFYEAWPWEHVWLGTSVEHQVAADRRIRRLIEVPAARHFLSCEPLLEPVELDLSGIGWVICGGESGPGHRIMQPAWALSLLHQCRDAGVPFFMKQMAGRQPIPDELMVREFPGAAVP